MLITIVYNNTGYPIDEQDYVHSIEYINKVLTYIKILGGVVY